MEPTRNEVLSTTTRHLQRGFEWYRNVKGGLKENEGEKEGYE